MTRAAFQKIVLAVLGYTLAVVVWGAYVRATSSGAGCGAHWPLCNGDIVPRTDRIQTLIEFSHRSTAGLSMLTGALVAFFGWRLYPKGDRIRKAAVASFLFVLAEGLIGAVIVLYKMVEKDDSMRRAVSMQLHLVNTLFLMGALVMTAWWSNGKSPRPMTAKGQGVVLVTVVLALASVVLVATSGALAALGDTLFPPKTLTGALTQDVSGAASTLVRLRLLHPLFALIAAVTTTAAATSARLFRPNAETRLLSRLTIMLVFGQILLGLTNVVLLAPVWMQLLHLCVAELTWLSLVLLGVAALSAEKPALVSDAHHLEERAGAQ
ncbi:MAG TPA: COX15/CtaA family protein [Polyangiaceae bacterium]